MQEKEKPFDLLITTADPKKSFFVNVSQEQVDILGYFASTRKDNNLNVVFTLNGIDYKVIEHKNQIKK